MVDYNRPRTRYRLLALLLCEFEKTPLWLESRIDSASLTARIESRALPKTIAHELTYE